MLQIRDMTGVFIARAELLPPGESMEDHKKWQKDEADAVQQDKDNTDPRTGGLFKGCFPERRAPSLHIVRDQEDGVDRCPVCTWELEDGECRQCGLVFDETGEVSWGDSFSGFSDRDELSEHDAEDLDAEMDMEEVDFDGYEEEWDRYPVDQGSFMMRRFLEAGMAPNAAAFARRRPITHSEAGSRRSYSESIVSNMYGDEMDTVEEEDEDGLDEDSSMNDFIDDEAVPASSSASDASSTPGPAPQPPTNRRANNRARRVVESETSSTVSSAIAEEDEDEEDEGPIRRGVRNPAQTRALHRANGSRSSRETQSSTSTDVSTEDLDEDTQALLREEGWMLQRDADDDEMGEEDEDDSDGARTTVGWEPLANSNDRSRMGGSLTPTADRPRPSAPIRPPSRTGNVRVINASRGLRRRSSVLSTATAHYEDGEADDDDSDQDGDIDLAMDTLRTRRSQAQMRNVAAFSNPTARLHNRGSGQGDGTNELETDENSDNSQQGNGRGGPRMQRREYDPRISWMFAAHQQALQQHQMAGALIDVEPRAITPLARPRTRNRNRPSPAQAYSPFLPPTRLRTPLMDNTLDLVVDPRMPISPPRRSAMSPGLPAMANVGHMSRFDRAPSVSSSSNASTILTPSTSTTSSQHSIDAIAQTQAAAAMDMIDRPQVSARPGSATGRRNSGVFSVANPSFPHTGMGLHVQGAALTPFPARTNPWAAFVQARGVRNRNSRQLLREQSSVATLRPVASRVNILQAGTPPQGVRPQPSRLLRPQPSRRGLNSQASTRTLRPPPTPTQNVQPAGQPAARPIGLTPDERNIRARELIETRRQALGQRDNVPARTNPFTQGFQRPVNPLGSPNMQHPTTAQHVRSNSNESINSTGTVQGAPASPGLARRRSNRNMMSAPPPGVLPPVQAGYTVPATTYLNGYYRPRPGSSGSGGPGAYEAANARGMGPMMAGPLI
jgi:hypothetical protein